MVAPKKINTRIIHTKADKRTILVRMIVGLIFLSEGIQKFLFPDLLGPGRFEKIGFIDPEFWAYFTAAFEIGSGIMVLVGFYTRLAVIPLFAIMITAFITTKWPILLEKGFWNMAHEYRTDYAITLLLIYLIFSGGGRWSADASHKPDIL